MILENGNELVSGMTFTSFINVAKFLGLKDFYHSNYTRMYMKHYCEWHRDGDKGLIHIDKAFDEERIPLKNQPKGYLYEVGQVIESATGKFIIKDRYRGESKYSSCEHKNFVYIYKCECLVHKGFEFELYQNRVKQGIGCPLCGKKKIVPGISSLYDEHPEVLKYLVNPEEAKNLTSMTNKKVLCKCPFCGRERMIIVATLAKYGFSCPNCSDHISYPNKFVRNFLNQVGIEYESEKTFGWSDRRIYDEYISKLNMIIENHGIQHYEETSFTDIKYQKSNDEYKKSLALENGIEHYVVLDCRNSEMDFIKNSIMESELPRLLNFKQDDIDWDSCDIAASTNSELIKVCEEYNKNNNITKICEMLHHAPGTVRNYLLVGTKAGICDYEKNNKEKNGFSSLKQTYPIYCITDDIYFASRYECEDYYREQGIEKFSGYHLYRFINREKPYKDKLFKYVSRRDFNKKKDESLLDKSVIVYGDYYDERYLEKLDNINKEELNNG